MKHPLKIVTVFNRLALWAFLLLVAFSAGAQVTDPEQLKQLFLNELKKSIAGQLPGKDQITLSLLPVSGLSQYKLQDKPFDAFYIKASSSRLFIGSASNEGLQNGVYWYLQQLGYRYYFPNEIWYYVPRLSSAFKTLEKTVSPSFQHRRIWYAYGTGSKQADNDFKKWSEANLQGGIAISAGHSYEGIVNRNKAVFMQHPEYFAQSVAKGQIPRNPKFEVSNDGLVQLVVQDAFNQIGDVLKKTSSVPYMISMDPSDGGGFSTSASSLKIGGPSEQTFYLANQVAKAVRQKYASVKVGLYAYNQHATPPKFDIEPNIVVLIATALNQSGFRTDELIKMWKQKGITIGIRDYYGVMAWDWDMPGQPRGGQIAYVNQLKNYYQTGIRYISAETNTGWISRGLGHYIATRLLWDIDENPAAIKSEFFTTMFGRAAGDMEQLFDAWQSYKQPVPLEGDLYSWSTLLEKASKAEDKKEVQQRITQVKQYLHYVFLFMQWRKNNTDDNLVRLLNYAYRVQDAGTVASYPLFRRLANAAVKGKDHMRFNDPEAVWKRNNKPLDNGETAQNFSADKASLNQAQKTVIAKMPETFAVGSVSTKNSASAGKAQTSMPVRLRGRHLIVLHVQNSTAVINIAAGLIKAKAYKSLQLNIYPYNSALKTEGEKPVLQETVQARQPSKAIALGSLFPGTYIAMIDDAKNGFTLSFTGNIAYGIIADSRSRIWTFGRNSLYFEVKGVNDFIVKNDGALTLQSPLGRIIDLQKKRGAVTIQVQSGEAGIWQIKQQSGVFTIQGITPLIASDKNFLLTNDE